MFLATAAVSLPCGHVVSQLRKVLSMLAQPEQEAQTHVFNKEPLYFVLLLEDCILKQNKVKYKSRRGSWRGQLEKSVKDHGSGRIHRADPHPEAETKYVGSNKQFLYLQCPDIFI